MEYKPLYNAPIDRMRIMMAISADKITEQLHQEIDQIPADRRVSLLKIVHAYREAVVQDYEIDPVESLKAGLADAKAGRIYPSEGLWDHVKSD